MGIAEWENSECRAANTDRYAHMHVLIAKCKFSRIKCGLKDIGQRLPWVGSRGDKPSKKDVSFVAATNKSRKSQSLYQSSGLCSQPSRRAPSFAPHSAGRKPRQTLPASGLCAPALSRPRGALRLSPRARHLLSDGQGSLNL
ncbi:hypothetical protein TRVL_07697 [Trypanosoma vivax]|nr:hypothetical protein TRVL_07697 [Trypanosoma vivax]